MYIYSSCAIKRASVNDLYNAMIILRYIYIEREMLDVNNILCKCH